MFWKTISIVSFIGFLLLGSWIFWGEEHLPIYIGGVSIKEIRLHTVAGKIDSLENYIWQTEGKNQLLRYRIERLSIQLEMSREKGKYLVIDRLGSKFYVRHGEAILLEGVCGVGMGRRTLGRAVYDWETPAGTFEVKRKLSDPWWTRPDWFWREKGMKKPKEFIQYPKGITFNGAVKFYNSLSKDDKLKVKAVPGYLGKYVMQITEGIYIHYGQNAQGAVSHGCIRVSTEDAAKLYNLLEIGTPVYIY